MPVVITGTLDLMKASRIAAAFLHFFLLFSCAKARGELAGLPLGQVTELGRLALLACELDYRACRGRGRDPRACYGMLEVCHNLVATDLGIPSTEIRPQAFLDRIPGVSPDVVAAAQALVALERELTLASAGGPSAPSATEVYFGLAPPPTPHPSPPPNFPTQPYNPPVSTPASSPPRPTTVTYGYCGAGYAAYTGRCITEAECLRIPAFSGVSHTWRNDAQGGVCTLPEIANLQDLLPACQANGGTQIGCAVQAPGACQCNGVRIQ